MISRIFRGENENAAVKRKRQIDTLKIFNDNVVELREDAEYQVQFNAGDRRMAIIVTLSPEFPLEKPILRITPSVSHHPWCNKHSEIINAPGLLNFTVHSDLGRVVQAIIREFMKNPPSQLQDEMLLISCIPHQNKLSDGTLSYSLQHYPDHFPLTYNSSCYNSQQYPYYSSSNTNICEYNCINTCVSDDEQTAFASTSYRPIYSNNHHPINSTHNVTSVATTTITTTAITTTTTCYSTNTIYSQLTPNPLQNYLIATLEFPELNSLNNEELIKLDEDCGDNLDIFVIDSPRLEAIQSTIDETIDSVEKIAYENLTKETELKMLQDEIALKMDRVSALKMRYDNLIQQYSKLSKAFTPDHIRDCLKYAADNSHEQSEKIAENFLEQKIDVECFLNTYIECRKLGQTRRTKEEKLGHQLNELKRAGY